MPLSKGKSEKSFNKNVKTEYEEGKPLKQSLAIAYAMKRKAKKMAQGGSTGPIEQQLTDNYQSPCSADCNDPSHPHNQEGGFEDHEGNSQRPNGPAGSEDGRKLNQHGEYEVGREGHEGHYAKGGGAHESVVEDDDNGESKAGEHVRMVDEYEPKHRNEKHLEDAKAEHYRILGELKADRKDRKFMAYGGEPKLPEDTYPHDSTCYVDPEEMAEGSSPNNKQGDQADRHDMQGRPMAEGGQITDNYADTEDGDGRDMVGRIMKQRAMEYSKGGQVANNTDQGYKKGERRDDMGSGQYDDLVLRDDDMEDADYTGANSGDEKDSSAENKRRSDIVSRIMASRRKKDKLPNPR